MTQKTFPSTTNEVKDEEKQPQGGYTAVVYVHGMGSQRRNEEVSYLVDCLDRYCFATRDQENTGKLVDIKAHLEPVDDPELEFVSLIRAEYVRVANQSQRQQVCFYEAYWAPLMAGGSTTWGVIKG